ncbi:MAG TPA: RNA polymerase sigma factor [Polyangiaceae bacterium]|jgi:RNA polymerase sigma-70 factor (ECF subfamily)
MGRVVSFVNEASAGAAARASVETIAWAELVPLVHRQMRALVGPTRDLEDLTQSALEQVLRGIQRFEGRAELSTFTYRVCAHVAMNHWRWWRRWLRRFEIGTEHAREPISPAKDATQAVADSERIRRLHAALEKLDPKKRLVLVLCDLEELPAPRVAEIAECGEPTVRSRLRQARIDLAALLNADPFFADDEGEEGNR